jgi:hypothetical protein
MTVEIRGAFSKFGKHVPLWNPHGSLPFSRDILKTDNLGQQVDDVLEGLVKTHATNQ